MEYHRVQLGKSVAEGKRLGEELKRTQESLLFLSAWDEEKIELESEVRAAAAGSRNDVTRAPLLVFARATAAAIVYIAHLPRNKKSQSGCFGVILGSTHRVEHIQADYLPCNIDHINVSQRKATYLYLSVCLPVCPSCHFYLHLCRVPHA